MKKKLVDLAERAGATFAQAFLALLVADAAGVTQIEAVKVAAVAGGMAVAKFLLGQAQMYLAKPETKDLVVGVGNPPTDPELEPETEAAPEAPAA